MVEMETAYKNKDFAGTRTIFGTGFKMILLDEADNMTNAAHRASAETHEGADNKKGLQRPVICICNDVHAAALRPLKAVAELVEFRSASNSQLVSRLKMVCKAERLAADVHTLEALCALSGNDVRT